MRVPSCALQAIDAVANVLYPPLCVLCLGPPATPGDRVCPVCRESMRRVGSLHPIRIEAAMKLAAGGAIDGFITVFLFEKQGPVQTTLHLLKYSGMHSLGTWLGRELGAAVVADPGFAGADLLVPVPLHPARLRERGYNQAERICAGISAVAGVPVIPRAAVRARNTTSQTALGLHEREENVRGAFRMRPGGAAAVAGKALLLVDDVMTTGATLTACARALRSGGARSVLAATAAVADRGS